jgi:hypothetical protein
MRHQLPKNLVRVIVSADEMTGVTFIIPIKPPNVMTGYWWGVWLERQLRRLPLEWDFPMLEQNLFGATERHHQATRKEPEPSFGQPFATSRVCKVSLP